MIFPDAYILRLLFDVINHVIIGGSAALLRGAFPGRAPPLAGLLCAPYRRPRAFPFLAGGLAWGFEPVRGSASNYRGGVSRASLAAGASSVEQFWPLMLAPLQCQGPRRSGTSGSPGMYPRVSEEEEERNKEIDRKRRRTMWHVCLFVRLESAVVLFTFRTYLTTERAMIVLQPLPLMHLRVSPKYNAFSGVRSAVGGCCRCAEPRRSARRRCEHLAGPSAAFPRPTLRLNPEPHR